MPLRVPAPPAEAADAVHTTFRAFADSGTFRLPALRNASGPLQLTQPHQVFTLGLADLAAGRGLEAATPGRWRYLVQEGDNALAAADTVAAGPGHGYVFSAFNEGRFVTSTAEAIQVAQENPEVSRGDFELRLLHVPGLHVMALWLHDGEGNANDLLVPLEPSPVDTPTGQPVPAAVLLQELAAKASPAAATGPSDTTGG
ncbi:MAG: hypothetical protein ABSA53_04980 [Streptosporangiaceae bacterium]|jgi:hypothetical protein